MPWMQQLNGCDEFLNHEKHKLVGHAEFIAKNKSEPGRHDPDFTKGMKPGFAGAKEFISHADGPLHSGADAAKSGEAGFRALKRASRSGASKVSCFRRRFALSSRTSRFSVRI